MNVELNYLGDKKIFTLLAFLFLKEGTQIIILPV